MDYIEAFKNLKTNQKYSRKSPHKAVLLLTVIKLFQDGVLSDNEIKYDNTLTSTFNHVWNRLLPYETKFFPEAYLPYWYLQSESFWHVIPIRGQESVLQLMRDDHIKPSETKLRNCVSYAELDEELFFQMTIPSSRRCLKQVLLETYFSFTDQEIIALLNADQQHETDQEDVITTFKNVFVEDRKDSSGFDGLTEDVQICLNLEYFTYLRNHKYEREEFKSFFPNVYVLYNRITEKPIKNSEVSSSFGFDYSNFLRDLKISLMSEDDAINLVDSIDHALDVLENANIEDAQVKDTSCQEQITNKLSGCNDSDYTSNNDDIKIVQEVSTIEPLFTSMPSAEPYEFETLPELPDAIEIRKGKPWTEDEEVSVKFYYEKGYSFDDISRAMGRTVVSIKTRLGMLGIIEYDHEKEMQARAQQNTEVVTSVDTSGDEFFIENSSSRCYIINKENQKIYSSTGKLKMFGNKPYRIAYTYSRLTINILDKDDNKFFTGNRIVNAASKSPLFISINDDNYLDAIEDIVHEETEFVVCVLGHWYNEQGELIDYIYKQSEKNEISSFVEEHSDVKNSEDCNGLDEEDFDYEPKGKLKNVREVAKSSYDLLFILAVADLMNDWDCETNISLDTVACCMIANAWEIMCDYPQIKEKENELSNCVNYLISESEDNMDNILDTNTCKSEIFSAIKDYPMAGVFEDTVESLTNQSMFNVLRAWFGKFDKLKIMEQSREFAKSCLYSINVRKHDSFIVINPKWKNSLVREHDNLVRYFISQYRDYVLSGESQETTEDSYEIALALSNELLKESNNNRHYFYIKTSDGAFGKGYYLSDENKFILVAGSIIAPMTQGRFSYESLYTFVTQNKCESIGDVFVLKEDETFRSASEASSILKGHYSDGWEDWCDVNNKTLKSVYRNR